MAFKNTNSIQAAQKRDKLLKEKNLAERTYNKTCKIAEKEYAKMLKVELEDVKRARCIALAEYDKLMAKTQLAYSNKRKLAEAKYQKTIAKDYNSYATACKALDKVSYNAR